MSIGRKLGSVAVELFVDGPGHLLGVEWQAQELLHAPRLLERFGHNIFIRNLERFQMVGMLQKVVDLPQVVFPDLEHLLVLDLVRLFPPIEHFLLGGEHLGVGLAA